MNVIGENLLGHQKVLRHDLRAIVRRSHFRNVLAFCLFVAAFYFAYRYAMSFSHATGEP